MTRPSLEGENGAAALYLGSGNFPVAPMLFGGVIATFIVVATLVGIEDGRNFSASGSTLVHDVASVTPGGGRDGGPGREARAGQLALAVTDVTASPAAGDPGLAQNDAGGRVLVGVRVINDGDVPQRFEPAIQQLVAGDQTFGADQTASQPVLGADLGPGDSIVASLAFDIPAGAEPSAIILRDSVTAPGAQVSLAESGDGGVAQ
ncbi:DUF4352 domain-containing protein [Mycobacteroides salmoniphilum]|uniref:Telomeric repeat-binding factor 2 n=1 Tax=Mycobacteroides salmoniphilum TaxID=404941 RepID=A0A4R8SYR8_9MYCO|nr:DUF4352 domain-containing protein [Mycobacteroides salmoniphilum]TDZ92701.1 Telomeric repeat-binding factor 2 [Mycobacteroides salmoniphilum]TEA08523.1 Telomeric repeat-binding factor 2 [Mycobacteroides salmoniphilum]